jgi:hypothetical protein
LQDESLFESFKRSPSQTQQDEDINYIIHATGLYGFYKSVIGLNVGTKNFITAHAMI